jgi:hypothetical protein
MSQERRHFSRIHFLSNAHLTTAGGGRHIGQIRDLSLKGALVAMAEGWQGHSGEGCKLEVPLNHSDVVVVMEGYLAHVEGNVVGVRCESIDLDSISHLRRLVELNLGDATLLDRELSSLVSHD